MRDFNDISGAREAYRQLASQLDLLTTQNNDMHKRRVINASDAIDDSDYVTLQQTQNLIAAIPPATTNSNPVAINNDLSVIFNSVNIPSASELNSEFKGGLINVRMFGAVGNGIVNDTAAIQRAIAYSASLTYARTIYFPAGIYLITSTLSTHTNLSLVGEGRGSTIIQYNGSGVAIDVIGTGFINATVTLRDFILKGNNTAGSVGIRHGHNTTGNFNGYLRVLNVYVRNFDKGLELRNTLWTTCERSEFSYNIGYGVYIDPQDYFTTAYFTDCRIANNTTGGLFITSTGYTGSGNLNTTFTYFGGNIEDNGLPQVATGSRIEQIRFYGTHFENHSLGIDIDLSGCRGMTIENCFFTSTGGNTIYASGNVLSLLLSNLTIYNGGRTTGIPEILIEGSSNNIVTIQNCKLDGIMQVSADAFTANNNITNTSFDGAKSNDFNAKFRSNATLFGASLSGDLGTTSGFIGSGKRQNYCIYSEALAPGWTLSGVGSAYVSAANLAPDGNNTATEFTFGGASCSIQQFGLGETNSKVMTYSFWARTVDGLNHAVVLQMYNNVTDLDLVFNVITPVWKRYSITHQFVNVHGNFSCGIRSQELSPYNLQVWGMQVNDGGLQAYVQCDAGGLSVNETTDSIWNENGVGKLFLTGINSILDGTRTGNGKFTFKAGFGQSTINTTALIEFRNYFNGLVGKLSHFNDSVLMLQLGMFRAENSGAPTTGQGFEFGYTPALPSTGAIVTPGWGNLNVFDRGRSADPLAAGALALQHTGGNTIIGAAGSTDDGVNKVQLRGNTKITGNLIVTGTVPALPNVGTAGTYVKTTFDAQGRETSGVVGPLAVSDGGTGAIDIATARGNLIAAFKQTVTAYAGGAASTTYSQTQIAAIITSISNLITAFSV